MGEAARSDSGLLPGHPEVQARTVRAPHPGPPRGPQDRGGLWACGLGPLGPYRAHRSWALQGRCLDRARPKQPFLGSDKGRPVSGGPFAKVYATDSGGNITQWSIQISVTTGPGSTKIGQAITTEFWIDNSPGGLGADLDNASINLLDATSAPHPRVGGTEWINTTGTFTPEPGTVTLLAMGLAAMAGLRRRRA